MVAGCGPGSEIAFSYVPPPEQMDEPSRELHTLLDAVASSAREPFISILTPGAVEELVKANGLRVLDHPEPAELARRYFADRSDGLVLGNGERLIAAGP